MVLGSVLLDVVVDVLVVVLVDALDRLNVGNVVEEDVNVSNIVEAVVGGLSNGGGGGRLSKPQGPLQATILPSTHSVPAAVGPKSISPPWLQTKKVVPPAPQKSWPSGEQLP